MVGGRDRKGVTEGWRRKVMGVRGEVGWLDEVMVKQGVREKSDDKGRRERNKDEVRGGMDGGEGKRGGSSGKQKKKKKNSMQL